MKDLNKVMKRQSMTFAILEEYCLSKYRRGYNPLPDVRKWLANMDVKLSVNYMETAVPINIGQAVDWAAGKKRPMVIVHALKIDGFVLGIEVYMIEGMIAARPAKNYSIRTKPWCNHCKQPCIPVELDEDKYSDVDFHGVECLGDVDQFLYEGGILCEECYRKEGGIV